ncbi:MAG: Rieske 2Fe-2S domain-containing protein [Ignavibacteria bacterium]|nr:Rieske 2Fe-2S domain-containing protein [Ignavibacteria bacterium]
MSEQKKTGLPPITSSVPVGGGGGARPATPAAAPKQAAPAPSAPAIPAPPTAAAAAPSAIPAQAQPVAAPTRPAAPVRKPRQDKPPENDQGIWRISRKNFLNVAGWFAFFSFLATATIGALRLMVPRVLYEPPSAFKAGYPEDYIVGEVDESYKDDFRVWIVREPDGFYAISAICTHLGCTPRWLSSEKKFKCPCHGSGFHIDGVNFEGPAPRPLERLRISLADDGRLLIDRKIKFLYEKQEWSKPGAFLRYT